MATEESSNYDDADSLVPLQFLRDSGYFNKSCANKPFRPLDTSSSSDIKKKDTFADTFENHDDLEKLTRSTFLHNQKKKSAPSVTYVVEENTPQPSFFLKLMAHPATPIVSFAIFVVALSILTGGILGGLALAAIIAASVVMAISGGITAYGFFAAKKSAPPRDACAKNMEPADRLPQEVEVDSAWEVDDELVWELESDSSMTSDCEKSSQPRGLDPPSPLST